MSNSKPSLSEFVATRRAVIDLGSTEVAGDTFSNAAGLIYKMNGCEFFIAIDIDDQHGVRFWVGHTDGDEPGYCENQREAERALYEFAVHITC